MTRLAVCSPVATGVGATARRMVWCPSRSSGLVGSSIEARSKVRELADPGDRPGYVPALVGVDGDLDVGSDGLAGQPEPAEVVC